LRRRCDATLFCERGISFLPFFQRNYSVYANKNLRTLYASVSATNPDLRKWRLRFDDLLVRI
jgi:hypothetical protein